MGETFWKNKRVSKLAGGIGEGTAGVMACLRDINPLADIIRSFICPSEAVAREPARVPVTFVAMGTLLPGNMAQGGEETPEIH